MNIRNSDLLIESKTLRETVIDRVEILDKVKNLITLPNDIHVTVEMAANYYEVDAKIIQKSIQRNKDEYECDGLRVVTGSELADIKSVCGISGNAARLTLIPKRAILRMGMLLRESEIAKAVRTQLLNIEEQNKPTNIVQIPTELNILGQLSEAINQSYKAMIQFQTQVAAADKKAEDANKKAEEAAAKNKELESELDDVRKGLVDVDLPLRTQFNEAVRKYAKRHGLEWDEAYNNVYSTLGKQNHVDLKKRLQNRVEKGDKVKMIDIVEELNLLVPAIRLAKTLAGVAS